MLGKTFLQIKIFILSFIQMCRLKLKLYQLRRYIKKAEKYLKR